MGDPNLALAGQPRMSQKICHLSSERIAGKLRAGRLLII